MEKHKCCICGKEFVGYGNNPWPYTDMYADTCCDECNEKYVIVARQLGIRDKEQAVDIIDGLRSGKYVLKTKENENEGTN